MKHFDGCDMFILLWWAFAFAGFLKCDTKDVRVWWVPIFTLAICVLTGPAVFAHKIMGTK